MCSNTITFDLNIIEALFDVDLQSVTLLNIRVIVYIRIYVP